MASVVFDFRYAARGQNYSPSKKADPWQKLEVQTINRADPTKGWPLEGPA